MMTRSMVPALILAAALCTGASPLLPALAGGEADKALAEIVTAQQHERHAADTLWGGLVMATNEPSPGELPAELRGQERRLTVFGYNHFRLIGQNRKTVPTGTEDWLVPGRVFSMRVDTKNPLPDGGYALDLQLFQQQKLLVEAGVKLQPGHPLFIRGPLVGRGQLIIVLMVL